MTHALLKGQPKTPLIWRLGRMPRARRCAVIDIGSNSVRLIVYQLNGRSMVPRINEKVMAGLGQGLSDTGYLSEGGVVAAHAALSRFGAICQSLGVTDIQAFATAAVRDAENGPEFCRAVHKKTGIEIQVLSGEEEAHFAAMGVIAAQRNPTGVIGDLGGSSLELIQTDNGELSAGKTYKLGPLALSSVKVKDQRKLEAYIADELRAQGKVPTVPVFYAVGGAWRAIAKTYMHYKNYQLHVLQSYAVPAVDMVKFCDLLADRKSDLQSLTKSITGRRYETLGLTALVLKHVLLETGAEKMVVSSFGVREGIVFSDMNDELRRLDPLLAGITTLAKPDTGQAAFSRALNDFLRLVLTGLNPVFEGEADQEERLIMASFILADIGATMHPDHRADIARQLVLRGPFTGIDHSGRIFLGLITGMRYHRRFAPTDLELENLTNDQIDRARLIAHLIRVAAEFSGRTERILRQGQLSVREGFLVLNIRERHKSLISEGVEKRLGQAASLMGLEPLIE